jgi:hypothetical protein
MVQVSQHGVLYSDEIFFVKISKGADLCNGYEKQRGLVPAASRILDEQDYIVVHPARLAVP